MVNNTIKGACLIWPLFSFYSFLILLSTASSITGQNLNRFYRSSPTLNGFIYYIVPAKGFFNSNHKGVFLYDITYLTSKDQVTLNFSYYDKMPLEMDSVVFLNNERLLTAPLKKLYISSSKSKYHYRYSLELPFNEVQIFFNKRGKPAITLYHKKGEIALSIHASKWKKMASINSQLLALMLLNKQ
jgi:hypothetical protein